jgi:glycine cleavage system H lipoate-binding protein
MIKPRSIPDLLKEETPGTPSGKHSVKILLCGTLKEVNSVIHQLHVLGFAEVIAWTGPIPSPLPGEVIRVLTRNPKIMG